MSSSAVILVLQTISATLGRLVPVAGRRSRRSSAGTRAWVGYLTAASTIGSLFMLTSGIGVDPSPRRRLRLAAQPAARRGKPAALSHSLDRVGADREHCVGLSNGAANPAGSEVLTRFTPPAHRNVVFSIKQAGVPLGGVIGGPRDSAADGGAGLALCALLSSPRVSIAAITR